MFIIYITYCNWKIMTEALGGGGITPIFDSISDEVGKSSIVKILIIHILYIKNGMHIFIVLGWGFFA